MSNTITVTKASGEIEKFQPEKLKRSLRRTGATASEIENIMKQLDPILHEGMSTKKIYSHAFKFLRSTSHPAAARYKLRRGIMELGPSGFPFEKFIGRIFEYEGYSVKTGQILQGHCVSHEIDVIAIKNNETILVECKYHNSAGISVDVKTPLYIHSRFQDVLDMGEITKDGNQITGWIATNSRFTGDAITFSLCKSMKLIGWDYPEKNALKDKIENSGLYPLTCLNSLTIQEKQWLLNHDKVLVKEVFKNDELLLQAGVSPKRLFAVHEEGQHLCEELKKDLENRKLKTI